MPTDFSTPQGQRFAGEIPTVFPLALLTALRTLDTPEDRDELPLVGQALNVRRRLGLSRVVIDQIRRYETGPEVVTADEVASLFTLVGRRPDAAAVFEAAGARIARENLRTRGLARRLGTRLLPLRLRRWRSWRRAAMCARRLCPRTPVRFASRSGSLEIEGGLPAHATEGGSGCALLRGLISEILAAYRAGDDPISHTRCEARGDEVCAWGVEAAADAEASSQPSGESVGRG